MRLSSLFALALATIAIPNAATAQTVTFDGIAGTDLWFGESYSEDGLLFTATGVDPAQGLLSWAPDQDFNADDEGRTLAAAWWEGTLTFAGSGGSQFNLISLDLADVYNSGAASLITYSYAAGGSTSSGQFHLDSSAGLQTFNLNLAGLSSFSIQQQSGGFQLDNVVLRTVSAVPEPATWAMLLFGFGVMGSAIRRRKKTFATAQFA